MRLVRPNKKPPTRYCEFHPDKPAKKRGLCENCYSKWLREHNPEYAERQRASHREFHRKNAVVQRAKNRAFYDKNADGLRLSARRRWRELNQEERWEVNLRGTYGITGDQFRALLASQNGLCAICQQCPKPHTRWYHSLFVDHDQNIGPTAVRGLLCGRCNTMLGYIERSGMEHVKRAIEYAERFSKSTPSIRCG